MPNEKHVTWSVVLLFFVVVIVDNRFALAFFVLRLAAVLNDLIIVQSDM